MPLEEKAIAAIAEAVTRLDPRAATALLMRRGNDPLWTGLLRMLREMGVEAGDVRLAPQDRCWAPPTPDDHGHLLVDGRAYAADVLIYHDPFGPARPGADLLALYRLLDSGVKVVFVDFPHGMTRTVAADPLRNAYLGALSVDVGTVAAAGAELRAVLQDSAQLVVRSGNASVLEVSRPFEVRDDFTSALLDVPVLQLPYGEVWVVAAPESFHGAVELTVARGRNVRARVSRGRLSWEGDAGSLPEVGSPMVELGIGLNKAAPWLPPATLFEKSHGRLHAGFGDSGLIGGRRRERLHFDLPLSRDSSLDKER
ncbi:hypothetical protein ACIHFD_65315 [Nonomuraea sp. NPDC051941]|uniref:hypothetical protein n=1 Tax=Nonomuraea sp. NPDC051941 TaxID=3364373 RepID=UPI0037CCA237